MNAEANVELDSTAVDALEDLRTTLERRGIVLGLTRVKFEVATTLARVGFLQRVGPEHVFMTLPTAVDCLPGMAGTSCFGATGRATRVIGLVSLVGRPGDGVRGRYGGLGGVLGVSVSG